MPLPLLSDSSSPFSLTTLKTLKLTCVCPRAARLRRSKGSVQESGLVFHLTLSSHVELKTADLATSALAAALMRVPLGSLHPSELQGLIKSENSLYIEIRIF